MITVLAYLAEGALGLPVFTNTPPAVAGPAYFLGPTGGYLLGFVVAAWNRRRRRRPRLEPLLPEAVRAMIVADVVIFALGFAWLAWFATLSSGATGLGVAAAFSGGVAPFLLGDLLKIVLAAAAVPAVWRLVER